MQRVAGASDANEQIITRAPVVHVAGPEICGHADDVQIADCRVIVAHMVAAAAALEHIDVVAGSTAQIVSASATVEQVVARAAKQVVVPGAT